MQNIKNQELPPIYERNGKKCYLDPIRKKLIYITPEETVRQRVISWLLKELKVPIDMISVEEHLSHYGVKSKRRADIVIHEFDEEHEQRLPIAVIECKAEGIFLGENVTKQVMDYTDTVKCDYAMITDGEASFFFKYNETQDKYDAIECLPEYEDMLDGEYKLFEQGEMPARIPFAEIPDKIDLYVGWDIGRSTSKEKAAVMVNLLECLLDPHHIIPSGQYRTFRLIEDYGVRLLTYGNAGGGSFSGPYRSFLIDINGNTEFVSIGVSSYYLSSKTDSEKTAICVAIDNEKDTHHSLQLSVDDNMIIVGEKVIINHSGRIGIGNRGSGKIDELRQFVADNDERLLAQGKFHMGTLTNNRLWCMDDEEIVQLVENLISYAVIRDEYRVVVKGEL